MAWPRVRDADEMHEALGTLGVVTDSEVEANGGWAAELRQLALLTLLLRSLVPWALLQRRTSALTDSK